MQGKLYSPLELNGSSIDICNSLVSCGIPWSFDVSGVPCSFEVDIFSHSFQAACSMSVQCGEDPFCEVIFGQFPSLKVHPLFADKPEVLYVPSEVRLAILELLSQPVLDKFSGVIGKSLTIADSTIHMRGGLDKGIPIPLKLHIEGEDIQTIPVRVVMHHMRDVVMLGEKLQSIPRSYRDISNLMVSVGIEVGYSVLSQQQVYELQVDDILCPTHYWGIEQKVRLNVSNFLLDCKISGGIATVMDINDTAEKNRAAVQGDRAPEPNKQAGAPQTQRGALQQQQGAKDAPHSREQQGSSGGSQSRPGIDVSGLEVPVVFELERRFMTVRDVGLLAPGYTFALSVDTQAPVTLRINGSAIGLGRLVEVNGTLGVQLVQVIEPKE